MLVMAVLVLVHVMELAALEMQQMRLVAVVVEEEGLRRRTTLVVLAPVAAAWVFWVKDQTGLRLTIISVPVALEVREVETVIVMTDQVTVVDMAAAAAKSGMAFSAWARHIIFDVARTVQRPHAERGLLEGSDR
jgi:hypothetical protein